MIIIIVLLSYCNSISAWDFPYTIINNSCGQSLGRTKLTTDKGDTDLIS